MFVWKTTKNCRNRRDRLPFLITVAHVSTNQRRSFSIFLSRWGNKSWFPNWAHSQFLISFPAPPLYLWLIFSDLNKPRQTASSSARSQTTFSLQGRVAAGQTRRRFFENSSRPICAEETVDGHVRQALTEKSLWRDLLLVFQVRSRLPSAFHESATN